MVPLAGLQIVQFKIFMVMGFCHVIIYALYPFAGNLISLVHAQAGLINHLGFLLYFQRFHVVFF